jgi:succinate dehydrogenase / fumarate reductase, cytochrome b subunit
MADARLDNDPAGDGLLQRNPIRAWFDVRRDRLGSWAFALNRLTGLGLVLYLFLHLGILSLLARGPDAWDSFVRLAKNPLVLLLDVVLIFGILFHGLNGIRVGLVGMGIAVRSHRTLFWVLIGIGAVLFVLSAVLVFTI